MNRNKLIFISILVLLFLVFLLQNTQVVTLRLYFWKISMSQIILIPLSILLGFILGFVTAKFTGKNKSEPGKAMGTDLKREK